jgi:hypothetical protein
MSTKITVPSAMTRQYVEFVAYRSPEDDSTLKKCSR